MNTRRGYGWVKGSPRMARFPGNGQVVDPANSHTPRSSMGCIKRASKDTACREKSPVSQRECEVCLEIC